MKRLQLYFALLVAMVFLLAFSVIPASAHGTDCRIIEKAKAITFEFFYDDREPMQYSEVLVFSPHDDKVEYQNGRTDSKGRFSFFPEAPGTWRIEASDGMGHMAKGTVDVAAEADSQTEPFTKNRKNEGIFSGNISKSVKIILGLSLILNIWMIFFSLRTRSFNKRKENDEKI